MKLKIPLTGKVTEYHPELVGLTPSGGISGDLNDPVKPVPINLGNVSWKLVSIDLANDLAEIEVTPSDKIRVDTGKLDAEKKPIYETREATEQEKQGFLDYARNLVEGHTKDELYAMSGTSCLVKSEEIMREYREVHEG
ncbi:hypothetical protein ES703_113334 [subsurface metagenome]